MRIAVYDRFWSTGGGGERFAAGIAQVLAPEHEVVLLAEDDVDLDRLGERLRVDLSQVGIDVVRGDSEAAVYEAGARYDLLVNASYTSSLACGAPHGLYVVHFPTTPQWARPPWRRRLTSAAHRALLGAAPVATAVVGLHPPEATLRHVFRWTDGSARYRWRAAPGPGPEVVHVLLGRYLPHDLDPVPVEIHLDGRVVARTTLTPPRSRLDRGRVHRVTVDAGGSAGRREHDLRITSPVFVPARRWGGSDRRRLGVPVIGVVVGAGSRATLASRLPALTEAPAALDYLDTYDAIAANSEFTRRWIRRLWGRDAAVLYPPVTLHPPGPKQPTILSVGRFIAPAAGHVKKQIEMVRAFRDLLATGVTGWSLHLVGGCADDGRDYLEQVRSEARGLPVEILVDATGDRLAAEYASASVYWHATGLGEDPDRHPERFEHFGITTVEAMSTGTVPVVIGAGGQPEVVRDGVDGFLFHDAAGLVERTRTVISDPDLRARMSASAQARAREFGPDAFAAAVRARIDEITRGGAPAR